MLDEEKMDDHSYFVGPMSKPETYHELKSNGDFLVRIDPKKGYYVLSLYWNYTSDIHDFELCENENGDFFLDTNTTRLFENPCDLIKSYRHDKGVLPTELSSSQGARSLPVSPECLASPEIPNSELLRIKDLGAGNFGKVYQAIWRKRMCVAIKEMNANTMKQFEFKMEAKNMTKLRHPNLVTIYGIEVTSSTIRIVLEYMNDGSLLDYLHNNKETLKQDNTFLVSAVVQVLKGMEYLSRRGYVHRDLAARNCLVNGRVVKVADFGLTRFLKDFELDPFDLSKGFSLRWSPPEVLLSRQYTTQSDVWSFGVLMWEIFTLGEMPYNDLRDYEVETHVLAGIFLPKPPNCDDRFYELMQSCWFLEPFCRPFFAGHIFSYIDKEQNPITKEVQMHKAIQENIIQSDPFWVLEILVVDLIGSLGYSLINTDKSENKQNKCLVTLESENKPNKCLVT